MKQGCPPTAPVLRIVMIGISARPAGSSRIRLHELFRGGRGFWRVMDGYAASVSDIAQTLPPAKGTSYVPAIAGVAMTKILLIAAAMLIGSIGFAVAQDRVPP